VVLLAVDRAFRWDFGKPRVNMNEGIAGSFLIWDLFRGSDFVFNLEHFFSGNFT
jgi:hypothetical protein